MINNPPISTSGVNSVVYVDGVTYPRTSAGITAAINSLPGAPGLGVVYLTGGTNTLTATVNNRSNTRIQCDEAAVLTLPNSTTLSLGMISFAGSDHATIGELLAPWMATGVATCRWGQRDSSTSTERLDQRDGAATTVTLSVVMGTTSAYSPGRPRIQTIQDNPPRFQQFLEQRRAARLHGIDRRHLRDRG